MDDTYLHTLYPNLGPQINEALNSGYSFQQVHDHIAGRINEARRSGYSGGEIAKYTGATIDIDSPQGYNPFLSQTYRAFSTLNEGTAGVIQKLPEIGQYINDRVGFGRSEVTDMMVKQSVDLLMSNKEYWEGKAKEKGVNFIDELIGDAVGGFIPWVAEFAMGIPYFAAQGAIEAKSKGQSEFAGAFYGALERGILGKLFEVYSGLKKPLAAVSTGGTFAVQTWAKGGDIKEIEKAFLTGVMYSLGGKGRIGVKEIRDMHTGKRSYELNVRNDAEILKGEVDETNEKIKAIPEGEKRVAIETKDGKLEVGDKGEVHATVATGIPEENINRTGFVDNKGEFTEKAIAGPEVVESNTYQGKRMTSLMGPNDEMIVAKREGKDVGFLWATKEEGGFKVHRIEVDPEFRRQGIATELIKEGEAKWGPSKGAAVAQTAEGEAFTKGRRAKVEVPPAAGTYDTFIAEGVGAEAARKEVKLYGTLLEQQKAAEADVERLKDLAITKPAEVFMKGNVEALEQYAQRVDRDVFVDKMKKLHPFDENSLWAQEGYESAGDFWDKNAAPSKEITKDLFDRNWSKVGALAEDVDKKIDQMINTAERMGRAAFDSGDKVGALREHKRMVELKSNREVIKREHDGLKKESKSIVARIMKMSKQENVDPDYHDHIQSILEDYDLHTRTKKILGEREATLDFIKRQEDAGETIYIPEDKLAMLRKKPLNDVTMEELRNLEEVIEAIAHQGALKSKLLTIGKKRDFNDTKTGLLDSMKENINNYKEPVDIEGKFPSERGPEGYVAKFKHKVGQLHGATKVEYIMDRLDGFKGRMYEIEGKWAEVFKSRVEAENKELKLKEVDVKAIKDAIEPIKDKFRSMVSDKTEIDGRMMTGMEAVSVYWNSKNEGNRNALKKGLGLSDENIDNIVKTLKPEEIKFADDVMALIQSKGPEIARVLKELTGEGMKFEKNYFPLWFDYELSDRMVERQKDINLFKQVYSKVSVGRKFTVSRVGGVEAPYLSFDVALKHLDRVNHFIANAEAVRDFQKLMYDKDIKMNIEANAGEGAYREMTDWMKEWANPRTGYIGELDRYFGILRHNTTLVALGCKVSTMVLQPTAYAQLINRIGFNNAMAGLMDFYRHPSENLNTIYELSPTMKTRMHSFDRDLMDFLNTDAYFSKQAKLKEAAMCGISILDLATTAPAWWSAYNLGMKKFGWDQVKSVEYADKMIRTTQASGLSKDLPGVLRGSNFKKSFAMFYTYFSSTYNEAMRDVGATRAGEQSIPSLMRTFMWLFIIPAVIETAFKKREEFTAEEYTKNLVVNIGTSIPYVGPVINAATTGFNYQASPMMELPKELTMIWTAKEPVKKLKHSVMATGYLTGFPSRQAILTTQYLADLMSGRSYDPANLIYREKEKKGGWK